MTLDVRQYAWYASRRINYLNLAACGVNMVNVALAALSQQTLNV